MTNISKGRVDVECMLSSNILQSENNYTGRCQHEILQSDEATILETDAYGVGLGAGVLQTREGTRCPRDEAPDYIILRTITFASKSLSATNRYSNIEGKELGLLHFIIPAREISIITNHNL